MKLDLPLLSLTDPFLESWLGSLPLARIPRTGVESHQTPWTWVGETGSLRVTGAPILTLTALERKRETRKSLWPGRRGDARGNVRFNRCACVILCLDNSWACEVWDRTFPPLPLCLKHPVLHPLLQVLRTLFLVGFSNFTL